MQQIICNKQCWFIIFLSILLVNSLCDVFVATAQGQTLPGDEPMISGNNTMVSPAQGTILWRDMSGEQIPLGELTLTGWEKLVKVNSQNGSVVVVRQDEADESTGLTVTYTPLSQAIKITFRTTESLEDLRKFQDVYRLLFFYSNSGLLPRPMSVHRQKRTSMIDMQYGPVTLSFHAKTGTFGWMGHDENRLQVNLSEQGLQQLVGDGLEIKVAIRQDVGQMREGTGHLLNRIDEVQAYIEGIRRWNFPGAIVQPIVELSQPVDSLGTDLERFQQSLKGDLDSSELADRWSRMKAFTEQINVMESRIHKFLEDNQEIIYEQARQFNEMMRYRVGLAIRYDPRPQFTQWALFNLNGMRLNAQGIPIETEDDPDREEARSRQLHALRQALQEIKKYGAKVNELAVNGPRHLPQDIVAFTHDYIPTRRAESINSASRRDGWFENVKFWAEKTKDLDAILTYKIGNEPFWDTGSRMPVKGYSQAAVGCSPQTFQQHVRDRYATFAHWREAASTSPQFKPVESWQCFEDMRVDPAAVRGLTLVDYLQEKYGSLEQLNLAWFGGNEADRAFTSWDEVFPPRPVGNTDGMFGKSLPRYDLESGQIDPSQNPMPTRPEDIPAWVDFTTFWSLCVNDRIVEISQRVQREVADVNVSTNSCVGHYINGFRCNAVMTSLNPWLTCKNLPSLHIDFYSTAYLQAYMRSLAGAAEGRPFYISEAGGSENRKMAAYMALYAYAYGADGMTYWRRDEQMPATAALGVSDAMHLLHDVKLQNDTQVVTDGLALIYSLDSLLLANAEAADALYLNGFQGAALLMNRMQVLYDMYSDEYLARQGVPSHIKTLLVPHTFALNSKALKSIKHFVDNGGVLITTPNFARFDPHGKRRDASELKWLKDSNKVVLLPEKAFQQWRLEWDEFDDHDPLAWAKPLPDIAGQIETILQERTPRTVTYWQDEGERNTLPSYAPGARRASDGTLYVFVDPWAGATKLVVRGDFAQAVDLSTGEKMGLTPKAENIELKIEHGPTIVRLDP